MTKVTIGITCYNAALTIGDAVISALAQSHPDIEVLIVDDRSTDNTAAVLTALQSEHPTIRVITQPVNGGVAVARNTLLDNATGEFIAFFDDDDTSAASRVAVQLSAIHAAEAMYGEDALVVCHTARTQVYPNGEHVYCPTQIGMPTPRGKQVALRILLGKPLAHTKHGAMATCSQMARVATYKKLGGFDASLRRSEDTDFNIRLALAGGTFVGIGEPLVTQHMTLGQEKRWDDEHTFTMHVLKKYDTVVREAGFAGFAPAWATMKLAFLKGDYLSVVVQGLKIALRYPWQTLQRVTWVLPNVLDNLKIRRFRRGLNCL